MKSYYRNCWLTSLIIGLAYVVSPKVHAQESDQLGFTLDSSQFVLIQAGSFEMGSTRGAEDELPTRRVTISQSFFIQKTEVTQAQWEAVMDTNPSHSIDCGPNCPVDRVSWEDIQEFIHRLNELDPGKGYRLPTEAEWEFVARAGSVGDYSGHDPIAMGWFSENSGERPHPVAQKLPNEWGLYDVHGNVWEWVNDWFGEYQIDWTTDPIGSDTGTYRVLRGGSWFDTVNVARTAHRNYDLPTSRYNSVGFRIVKVR